MNNHTRAAHLRGAGPLAAGLQCRIDNPYRSVGEQRCANHGPRPVRSTLHPHSGAAERSRPMFLRKNSAMRNSGCDVHGAPHSGSGDRQDAPQSGAGAPPQDAREGPAGQHRPRGGWGSPPGPPLSKASDPGVARCTGEAVSMGSVSMGSESNGTYSRSNPLFLTCTQAGWAEPAKPIYGLLGALRNF
jgi:hypothetical protein